MVRGVNINWSSRGLNEFLGTPEVMPCPLVKNRLELKKTSELGRREVKDVVCRP
ncbi:hypothetical protein A2U01_0094955, partial [Trifolium medium]|nr:hypothetical protein [Trifolium medium]